MVWVKEANTCSPVRTPSYGAAPLSAKEPHAVSVVVEALAKRSGDGNARSLRKSHPDARGR